MREDILSSCSCSVCVGACTQWCQRRESTANSTVDFRWATLLRQRHSSCCDKSNIVVFLFHKHGINSQRYDILTSGPGTQMMNVTGQCLNWRDVGESLRNTSPDAATIPPGRLYRGGQIDFCPHASLGHPRTVLNLRQGPDPSPEELGWPREVSMRQIAASNKLDKYDTAHPDTRAWLAEVATFLASPGLAWPVLIHCRSGRDRTGVVVAMLLRVCGVPEQAIRQEFAASQGAQSQHIDLALSGFRQRRGELRQRGEEGLRQRGEEMQHYFRGDAHTRTLSRFRWESRVQRWFGAVGRARER